MALFGGSSNQNRPRPLLEFKAGKMNLRSAQHMVYPDKRKGLIYIHQGPDSMMHFCWKDRSKDSIIPEDDFVIFPNDAEFKRVTQNTTGRVYILKWKSNSKKIFFWMQEPKDDKDEEICKKVNELLNSPSRFGSNHESSGISPMFALHPFLQQLPGAAGTGINPSDLSSIFPGMSQSDILALLGASSGSGTVLGQNTTRIGTSTQRTATPMRTDRSMRQTGDSRPNTAPAATRSISSTTNTHRQTNNTTSTSSKPKTNTIEMSALTNVLSNLNSAAQPTSTVSDPISKPENFVQLLSNKDVQEKLRSKLPTDWTLPTDEDQCRTMIDSLAFKQALEAFSSLLQSRQLGSILDQFQFPSELIEHANNGDMKSFTQALERYYTDRDRESTDKTMDTI